MDHLPDWVKTCLASWFSYPGKELFCQVSTVGQGISHIRSMLLYDITQAGHFIFLSRNQYAKVAGSCQKPFSCPTCVKFRKGQIIIQGTATLKTVHNDLPFCQACWHKMAPETQVLRCILRTGLLSFLSI